MSINDYVDDLEGAARSALAKAKAIEVCPFHPEVTIRVGDDDAERHAYALATTILKSDGTMWMREDLMPAIKEQLDMAADDECPELFLERQTTVHDVGGRRRAELHMYTLTLQAG